MNVIENNTVDNSQDTGPVPVILRRDAAGNRVVFLLDTLSLATEGGSIEVWHEGHARDVSTVPLSYYHATTSLDDYHAKELSNNFAKGWLPKFGLTIRHRLYKSAESHHSHPAKAKSANETLRRSSDKKSLNFNQDEYLAKISVAIQAAVSAALKAVAEEYSNK